MHVPNGTRNEYRITYLTKFLREERANAGDTFEISKADGTDRYKIRVIPIGGGSDLSEDDGLVRIRLTTGWRRVH
jgi:hypothetical protein